MSKYIPTDILKTFLSFYEKDDVWQIHSGHSWLTVFLFKESQIDENQDLPKYAEMKAGYLRLVKKYLDPPYSDIDEISLSFNSKENFEEKYDGNWYDYYH